MAVMAGMRDSKGGSDEIAIGILRAGGPRLMRFVAKASAVFVEEQSRRMGEDSA